MTWLMARVSRRIDPRALGILRVTVGITAILKAIELAPALIRFDDPGTLRIPYFDGLPSILQLGPVVLLALWIGVSVLFAAGAWTSIAGVALTGILGAVLLADQQLYSNHLYLLLLLVALLTLGRAGSAISVDARRGNGRDTVPGWPVDLLKIQVTLIYLFAAIAKLNAVYLSGSVMAVTLRRDGPLAVPESWRTFEVMGSLAVLSILTELFIAICLWLPRWRRTAFVVGLGLHFVIAIWLDPPIQLWIFGLMILPTYLLFLNAPLRGHAVVWDDSCGFCGTVIRWVHRLDWMHAIRLVPSSDAAARLELNVSQEDADRALQLVDPRGRHKAGFAAVQRTLELLPVSFLWAPLLRLPPVMAIGSRVYRRVAERRRCNLPRPTGANPYGEPTAPSR